jgi:hypothetical protein
MVRGKSFLAELSAPVTEKHSALICTCAEGVRLRSFAKRQCGRMVDHDRGDRARPKRHRPLGAGAGSENRREKAVVRTDDGSRSIAGCTGR